MGRHILRGALALVAVIAVLAVAALGYRAWRQHENARALAIHTPNGIAETDYVRLGGIDQWIQIRGEDRRNPVILFLHGGPGSSESALSSLFRPWEKHFTVVMWDQRCAGKTFVRNGAASCKGMTLESIAQDGIDLTQFLRRHLHHRKIILLGHSWGTMLGVRMVKERPDLFSAYVGTGQVVSIPEKEPIIYARTLARLRAAGAKKGIAALKTLGPPPYRNHQGIEIERKWSQRYDIPSERDLFSNMTPVAVFAPGWSLLDLYGMLHAPDYAEKALYKSTADYDARKLGPDFRVPFFIVNGALDNITPTDLARNYFGFVHAPHKEFIVVPDAGHSAVLTRPDAFLHILLTRVRPIAIQYENENGEFHG